VTDKSVLTATYFVKNWKIICPGFENTHFHSIPFAVKIRKILPLTFPQYVKINIHKTITSCLVLYQGGISSLAMRQKYRLRVFEKTVLRKL
jgi:hypothetical protein